MTASALGIERPLWFSCATTTVGHVRKINEDAFLDARESSLWVVADGMGGHSRGDRASQAIVEKLQDFSPTVSARDNLDAIVERLSSANDYCRQAADGQVMGSTVAALHLQQSTAYLVWCGDSRIYRFRDGSMEQLTEDHSLVQELARLGELSPDEAENHPSSNVITRAIGVSDELDVQIRQLELLPGDRFLVCSDGMFKDVAFGEVAERLSLPAPSQALDALVEIALRRGGTDNVTGIVVQVPTEHGPVATDS